MLKTLKTQMAVIFVLLVMVFAATVALSQTDNDVPQVKSQDNTISEKTDEPTSFSSFEGQFSVVFPAGCPRILTRSPEVEPGKKSPFVYVYCDRNGSQGEGYSISTWFDAAGPGGSNPGMDELKAKMEDALAKLGVVVVKQVPLSIASASGTKMEGMDLLTQTQDGLGQAWLRGWIVEDRLYLVTAWRSAGDLLKQVGLSDYFNSFQPL